MPRRPQLVLPVLLAAVALAALSGCADSDAADNGSNASQVELAQQRAQQGLLQSYTATYELGGADDKPGAKPVGTMTVSRTPTHLRMDIATSTGVASSITTPEGTVACQKPASAKPPTCITVAGPGQTPPPAFDPVLKKTFGDVLRAFAAGSRGLTVEGDADDTTNAAGVECRHFDVVAPPDGKVPLGIYCLSEDGIPVWLEFPSGNALLTKIDRTAPSVPAFTPVVSPVPLPTS